MFGDFPNDAYEIHGMLYIAEKTGLQISGVKNVLQSSAYPQGYSEE